MRFTPCSILLLALAIIGTLPSPAQTGAQTAKPRARAAAAAAAKSTPAAAPAPTGPPPCNCAVIQAQRHLPAYSARQETKTVQTLSDGTTITHITEELLWRDADGRTRTETLRSQPDGADIHYVSVMDPVAGVRMNWTVGGPATTPKVVTVYSLQPAPQPVPAATPAPQPNRRYYPYSQQSLPPTTIDDLYVEGYRTTRTIPAGYDGNDHDITSTTEYWTSPDLGLMVRRIMDDPRSGKSTSDITDLKQAPPDPALFKAPAGYEVRKANP